MERSHLPPELLSWVSSAGSITPAVPPLRVSDSELHSPVHSFALVFAGGAQLLLRTGSTDSADTAAPVLPMVQEMPPAPGREWLRLGSIQGSEYLLLLQDSPASAEGFKPPTGFRLYPVRELPAGVPARHLPGILRGLHLHSWHLQTRFCPTSGKPLTWSSSEIAKLGSGAALYPRLSPAIIVAVERGDRILLAQGVRHRGGFYSLLAGFVEAGESIEQAVHREVREEVGIEIEDLQYLGSQPWPFPDALMLGFRARWRSGELQPDQREIASAGWFRPDELPPLPPRLSIARSIISRVCADLELVQQH